MSSDIDPGTNSSAPQVSMPQPEARASEIASPSGKSSSVRQTPAPANIPVTLPSGTSGTSASQEHQELVPTALPPGGTQQISLVHESLPDLPDPGNSSAGQSDRPSPGQSAADSTEILGLPVAGELQVGRLLERRDRFARHRNFDLRVLLSTQDLPPDTVIEATAGAQFSVLAATIDEGATFSNGDDLQAVLDGMHPMPDAGWIDHGGGLQMVYVGSSHVERAVTAAFALPENWRVVLSSQTQHPAAASSAHPNASCSPIWFPSTDPQARFAFGVLGRLTMEHRQQALEILGMEQGGQYDHILCPVDPSEGNEVKNCVSAGETGVYCHHCLELGVKYQPQLPAGFFPYTAALEPLQTQLDELARHLVHWAHARLVLRHHYPHLGEELLSRAYELTLIGRWGRQDPRIPLVFESALDFVWGQGCWLTADGLRGMSLDASAASGLPYVNDIDWKSKTSVSRNPTRYSQAMYRTPEGYPSIRPVVGISFVPPVESIPVVQLPGPRHPIDLLGDPMPLEEALAVLGKSFPRVDTTYLQACLAAVICAEARQGQPPMLVCTGPAGSGKEQHIRLAASCMGQDIFKLTLGDDEERFLRQIGSSIVDGRRFLTVDELGKIDKLNKRWRLILGLNHAVPWRTLRKTRTVTSPNRAAYFFPCVTFPSFLAHSPEFNRRIRRVHLHRELPNWMQTSGGDTAEWRDRSPENARGANSILTHVYQLCEQSDFLFGSGENCVADMLSLGRLSDDGQGIDPEILREIYRHARGEDRRRDLIEDASFVKGWVDLDSVRARELIAPLMPDNSGSPNKAREEIKEHLEAQPWNDRLGISEPVISCTVKIHGKRWAIRFQNDERRRGLEKVNEQLPPIPDGNDHSPVTGGIAYDAQPGHLAELKAPVSPPPNEADQSKESVAEFDREYSSPIS